MDLNSLTLQEISNKLNNQSVKEIINPFPQKMLEGSPRLAAVLIPIFREGNEWHLLFIRRTNNHGDIHGGQVAFPGGSLEDGDKSIQGTALRETQEELGIIPEDIQILGKLTEFTTITNYLVTPFVGVIPWPYEIQPSPEEVSKVFTIPLMWLYDQNNREIVDRELPDGQTVPVIYFNEYHGEVLWGASARFTLEFLRIISE
jgi:8-oxo-dGTP pyrophosphatase MutT (NUDIX family)